MRNVLTAVVLVTVAAMATLASSHSNQDEVAVDPEVIFQRLTARATAQLVLIDILNDHAERLARDRDFPELQATLDIVDDIIATMHWETPGIYDPDGNLRRSCIWVPLTAEDCTSDCQHDVRLWTPLGHSQDALSAYYVCSQFSFHPLCDAGYTPSFESPCTSGPLKRCSDAWQSVVHFCDEPPNGSSSLPCYLEATCADITCEPECWGGVPYSPMAPHDSPLK